MRPVPPGTPQRAASSTPKSFRCRVKFDRPELVGARWWLEAQRGIVATSIDAKSASALKTVRALALIAGVSVVVGGIILVATKGNGGSGADSVTEASLDAQRQRGWDAGHPGKSLDFPGVQPADVTGRTDHEAGLRTLAADLAPTRPAFAPWHVPTLFQSPAPPSNTALRQAIRPILTDGMAAAFDRGVALRGIFEEPGVASDVAIVADLPGPEAVAFAAGLAPRFDPVFVFDNWPHPAGVVPAHLTLAAALYYRGWFTGHRAATDAPAAFVLDRNRLAPYVDAPDRFDNRYVARLPSAAALTAAGVKHVLYVVPDGSVNAEMDDLNDAFVALRAAGIDVKILALSDLRPETVATPPTTASPAATSGTAGTSGTRRYHYGGSPGGSSWFWHYYAWNALSRGPSIASTGATPPPVGRGFDYTPAPRATLFSSGSAAGPPGGQQIRPRGFGSTTFRTTDGSGSSSGRSGSIGRSGGSSFSG